MVGSHSSGDAATHRLTRIEDSYEAALADSQRIDPVLEGRREAIKEHLLLIDAKWCGGREATTHYYRYQTVQFSYHQNCNLGM